MDIAASFLVVLKGQKKTAGGNAPGTEAPGNSSPTLKGSYRLAAWGKPNLYDPFGVGVSLGIRWVSGFRGRCPRLLVSIPFGDLRPQLASGLAG